MSENQRRDDTGFRLSSSPGVKSSAPDVISPDFELSDLPQFSGEPALFAIARDPRTLFVYWSVDWAAVFGTPNPVERKVWLQARCGDLLENAVAIEPTAGSHFLTVDGAGATYRVELGYNDAAGVWNSIAQSTDVTTPRDAVSEDLKDVDLAAVPWHLSFQRMVDLFRASNREPLTDLIARLQLRATEGSELLTDVENEILRAMNVDLDQLAAQRRKHSAGDDEDFRKRIEGMLGFGSSSPTNGFSGSSWSG